MEGVEEGGEGEDGEETSTGAELSLELSFAATEGELPLSFTSGLERALGFLELRGGNGSVVSIKLKILHTQHRQ